MNGIELKRRLRVLNGNRDETLIEIGKRITKHIDNKYATKKSMEYSDSRVSAMLKSESSSLYSTVEALAHSYDMTVGEFVGERVLTRTQYVAECDSIVKNTSEKFSLCHKLATGNESLVKCLFVLIKFYVDYDFNASGQIFCNFFAPVMNELFSTGKPETATLDEVMKAVVDKYNSCDSLHITENAPSSSPFYMSPGRDCPRTLYNSSVGNNQTVSKCLEEIFKQRVDIMMMSIALISNVIIDNEPELQEINKTLLEHLYIANKPCVVDDDIYDMLFNNDDIYINVFQEKYEYNYRDYEYEQAFLSEYERDIRRGPVHSSSAYLIRIIEDSTSETETQTSAFENKETSIKIRELEETILKLEEENARLIEENKSNRARIDKMLDRLLLIGD